MKKEFKVGQKVMVATSEGPQKAVIVERRNVSRGRKPIYLFYVEFYEGVKYRWRNDVTKTTATFERFLTSIEA